MSPVEGVARGRWSPTASGALAVVWEGAGVHIGVHDPDTGAADTVFPLGRLPLYHPIAAPLPDDRVLVAGSPPATRAPTALIFDGDGNRVGEGDLGRYVANLFATPSGSLWVGYGEQAVFASGAAAPAIVRFDHELRRDAEYRGDRSVGFLYEGEVLALSGTVAWTATSRHQLLRLDPPHERNLGTGPRNAVALAVDDDVVAWVMQGRGAPTGRLDAIDRDWIQPWVVEGDLTAPRGESLPSSFGVAGRDDTIHAVIDNRWLRLRIRDLSL